MFFNLIFESIFILSTGVFLSVWVLTIGMSRAARLCENYMEKFHKVLTLTDYKNLANLDPAYRLVASSHKVGTGHHL